MTWKSLVSISPLGQKLTHSKEKKSLIIYVLGVIDMFVNNYIQYPLMHTCMLLVCNIFNVVTAHNNDEQYVELKKEIKGERDINLTWFGNLPTPTGESGYIFLFLKPSLHQ